MDENYIKDLDEMLKKHDKNTNSTNRILSEQLESLQEVSNHDNIWLLSLMALLLFSKPKVEDKPTINIYVGNDK